MPHACITTSVVIGCLVLLAGCATKQESTFELQQYGEMRSVMRDGQTEARVDLAKANGPGVIAVGALQGLMGEVTIIDGETWVARTDGGDVQMSGPSASGADQATLLTLATVPRWSRVELGLDGVASGAALEASIEKAASRHGVDTARPFPFVIEGLVDRLDIHVINGYCPHATDPKAINAEPWRWSNTEPVPARIVGFYAADAAGVLTHHGTSIHVHALIDRDGETVSGHIDGLGMQPGASLLLPASR